MPARPVGEKAEQLMEQMPDSKPFAALAQGTECHFKQIENARLFEIPAEDAQSSTICQGRSS